MDFGAAEAFWIERALYPAMEALKGNRVRQLTAELETTQFASAERLRALQEDKLRRLLLFCVKNVPAYRTLGLSEAQIQRDPFAALACVPLLTKQELRAHPGRYLADGRDPARLIADKTGGSTGEPLQFWLDRPAVERYEAARWRGLGWYGLRFGSRSVMVWGNPIELTAAEQLRSRLRDRFLKNRTILPAYCLRAGDAERYARFLRRYRPAYLYGYASALDALASVLEGQALPPLRAVVSTSETLTPERRERLRRVFRCPVVNEYGARDAGILAYECPCGRLHVTAENAVVELLDPVTRAPVPAGTSGVTAVTDLGNFAMPRLRYLLGDTATASPEPCPCGRGLPVLASLDGREDALFALPDGTLVHGNFINQLSRKYGSVARFRLVQRTRREAVLYLVQDRPDEGEAEAFRRDAASFLPGVAIRCERTDSLPPGPSGKFRYAVREFPL